MSTKGAVLCFGQSGIQAGFDPTFVESLTCTVSLSCFFVFLFTVFPLSFLQPLTGVTRALVLSLGVCYQARLRDRDAFRRHVAQAFTGPCPLSDGAQQIKDEIDRLVLSVWNTSSGHCHGQGQHMCKG